MNNSYLKEQKRIAYNNYNYFFMKMIIDIIRVSLKLAILLLINEIFDYTVINIITIIYFIISIFRVYEITNKYKYIIYDIRDTLGYDKFSFEIDLNVIGNNIFKGLLSYGK